MKRDVVECTVHGEKFVTFDYTKEQKESMVKLGKVLAKFLPAIRLDYPKTRRRMSPPEAAISPSS